VCDEFALANISTGFTTLPAGLNWHPTEVTGTANWSVNTNRDELTFTTGGTINSTMALRDKNINANYLLSSRTPAIFTAQARTLSTTNCNTELGLVELAGTGFTPNGIYFKRTDTATVGNWRCVTRAAGVETNTDSGRAGDANNHFFEIIIESTSSVKFYIDGTLEATHTTNIPVSLNRRFYFSGTEASVSKSFALDMSEMVCKR
jgi:hypothetical protein